MGKSGICVCNGDASKKNRRLRVLLLDDNPKTARAIQRDFGRHEVTVTATSTLAHARMALGQQPPVFDAIILELRLLDGLGESLLLDIETCPRQPAVIITSAHLHELPVDILEYRPVVIAKPVGTAALLRVVKTVAPGYTQPMIRRFIRRFDLSRREAQTLSFLAQGLIAKEIGRRMSCAEKTIYFHLENICRKMDCRDYHEILGRLLSFSCQALGHTPPEHSAFVDPPHAPNQGPLAEQTGATPEVARAP